MSPADTSRPSSPSPSKREQARLDRKARRQARRREDILDAAGELLRREGIAGFTMAAVAREADVSKPSVYYYFADQKALVGELARRVLDREVQTSLAAIESAADGIGALGAVVVERTRLYAADLDGFRLLFLWPQVYGVDRELVLTHVLPQASKVNGALEQRLVEEREAGRLHPQVRPRVLVNAAISASQGILAYVSGMEMIGDSMKFTALTMAEEAASTLMRGAMASGVEAPSLATSQGSSRGAEDPDGG